MLNFTLKAERCDRCGLCFPDCPVRIIAKNAEGFPFVPPESEGRCLQCQHCMAICPTGAISVFGLDPNDSLPVSPEVWPTKEQMTHLLRGRRSVRHYLPQNVDPALIDRLLATVAHAPTGINFRSLTFTVIDDLAKMRQLRERMLKAWAVASKNGRIPERLAYIERGITADPEQGLNLIFRGAPHLLIVSAPPQSPCLTENVPIALSYFELLAQCFGLGTLWCGLLKRAFEVIPELKALVDLPPDHHYYPMLFGYPAIHYARTVQRDNQVTIRRVNIPEA